MKKTLSLILAALMLAGAAMISVSADELDETVEAEETAEVEVESEATGEEEESTEAAPEAKPEKIAPTTLKNFKTTRNWQVLGTHSSYKLNNGVIEVRPDADDDAWTLLTEEDGSLKDGEDGKFIDATVNLDIARYLARNKDTYTSTKLTVNSTRKYLAYKVKQGNNYTEDPVYELIFRVPVGTNPNELGEYWLYSSAVVTGADGFDYIVFDASTGDDFDMWTGTLSQLELKWASREVTETAKDEAFMDIYEICFFESEAAIEAYVGSEVDWEAYNPPVVEEPEETTAAAVETEAQADEKNDDEDAGDESTEETKKSGGCGSVVASASIVGVVALAAGAVICKKKED